MKEHKTHRKAYIAIAVVFILHMVGFFGLQSSFRHYFESLTPLNLLIAFALIFYFHQGARDKQLYFFAIAFSLGMIVEIIGVKTGFPFGTYYYTEILSLSFMGVPLMIGVNWFLLSYGILAGLNHFLPKAHYLLKVAIAAFSMTLMDMLIEPFAIRHQLWVWASDEVPLANYISWFLISFVLFLFAFKILPEEKNKVAWAVIIIFLAFFGLNNLFN